MWQTHAVDCLITLSNKLLLLVVASHTIWCDAADATAVDAVADDANVVNSANLAIVQ